MATRRSLLTLTLILVCSLVVVRTASADSADGVQAFDLSSCGRVDLAPAASEGILVPLCRYREGHQKHVGLGTLLPDGHLNRQQLPVGATGPFASGPAGEIWAGTDSGGSTIGIYRIAADGSYTHFQLGSSVEGHAVEIYGLVADEKESVWVATGELSQDWLAQPFNSLGGELLHVAADGTVTRFPVPEHVEPHALVRGPDGNLWFVGESGRALGEHSSFLGKGYVGRMTPTGDFALFPTATEQSAPGGIAVGPDGRLWFTETGPYPSDVATIDTDGNFGPAIAVGGLGGALGFGSDGNVWVSTYRGVTRITAHGQRTLFALSRSNRLAIGKEGDVWTRQSKSILRIVPGAPGLEVQEIEADRRTKKVRLQIACGGSGQGCSGALTISLAPNRGVKQGIRLLRIHYMVSAESERKLKIDLPAEAFALARNAVPRQAGDHYVAPVVVRATVEDGPTLDRRFRVPGLVPK